MEKTKKDNIMKNDFLGVLTPNGQYWLFKRCGFCCHRFVLPDNINSHMLLLGVQIGTKTVQNCLTLSTHVA